MNRLSIGILFATGMAFGSQPADIDPREIYYVTTSENARYAKAIRDKNDSDKYYILRTRNNPEDTQEWIKCENEFRLVPQKKAMIRFWYGWKILTNL